MARGDLTVFDKAAEFVGESINLETDTFKAAIIDNVVTPAQNTANPTWDATSSQDYDGNEVSTAGGYPLGGLTISGPQLTLSGAVATWDDDGSDLSLAQNGSGFTNGYWAIIYSDTAPNKPAVCFIDLGGPVSEQEGPININFGASGVITITRS
jgi:hypothetical protein